MQGGQRLRQHIYISQGEEAIGSREDDVIATILGSCVAVCLWDPLAKVGGMNHLLLPYQKEQGVDTTTGAIAMERLINRMIPRGAMRMRLRAKIFGGANMLSGSSNIGARNAEFARNYLKVEGIPCEAESLGGMLPRNIQFRPTTGVITQKFVQDLPETMTAQPAHRNDVELF